MKISQIFFILTSSFMIAFNTSENQRPYKLLLTLETVTVFCLITKRHGERDEEE